MTLIDTASPHRIRAGAPVEIPVAIYGNRWCGITQMIRRALDRAGIRYSYVDLDRYPEAERKLRLATRGTLRTPVVYIDGEWLMEPTVEQVRRVLARHASQR